MKISVSRFLKEKTPEPAKIVLYRSADLLQSTYLSSVVSVNHYSSSENLYHCCTQRTASQWLKRVLSDARVYRYSGLKLYNMRVEGADTRHYEQRMYNPFPKQRIVSSLYISYKSFLELQKPHNYKAFFVIRDPRDVVVSHYFSSRYSHAPMGDIPKRRERLNQLSVEDGLVFTIEYLQDLGLFEALGEWHSCSKENSKVLLLKYEDITGNNQYQVFQSLFEHCDIDLPEEILDALLKEHRFEAISGRGRGNTDKESHYRTGQAGDWEQHFTAKVKAKFDVVTLDLVQQLGYI